jgi:hypothetical protein
VSCGGFCNARSAADWPTQIFEGDYEQYRDPERFTVRRDETLPDGVFLLAESRSDDRTTLAIGRWNDGDERFFSCLYQTEEPVDLVIAQFEVACTRTEIGGLPWRPKRPQKCERFAYLQSEFCVPNLGPAR